jgi:hypothetical protein
MMPLPALFNLRKTKKPSNILDFSLYQKSDDLVEARGVVLEGQWKQNSHSSLVYKYFAVIDSLQFLKLPGVPSKRICPPLLPPSTPTSIIQSGAHLVFISK